MPTFVQSRNARPNKTHKTSGAFEGAAARMDGFTKHKPTKNWKREAFLAKRARMAKDERATFIAAAKADQHALACLAAAVALSVLTV